MGNQPSRKTTGSKGSRKRPLKMIKGAKKSIQQKNVKQTVKIAVGVGLKSGGKGVLATLLLAASKAYNQYKSNPSPNISKISYSSVSSTSKSSMPREGRSVLRSSISTALSSLGNMKNEDRQFIETVLKQTLYGVTEKFLTHVIPENQDPNELSKDRIMAEAYDYVEKKVPKIITKLEKNGINFVTDIEQNPDVVAKVVDKVEKQMEENAKKLSEK